MKKKNIPKFEMRKTNWEGIFRYKGHKYGIIGMNKRRVLVAPHPKEYDQKKTIIVKPYPHEYELTPIEDLGIPYDDMPRLRDKKASHVINLDWRVQC